jgi:CHAT domain-containing protein
MQNHKEIRQHQAVFLHFFICLFFIFIVFPVYSRNNTAVSDSIIDSNIRNANFEDALKLVSKSRQQNLSNETKNAILLLKTSEIYIQLGNHSASLKAIAEAEKVIFRINNPGHELRFQFALQKGKYFNYIREYVNALTWLQRAENQAKYIIHDDPGDVAGLYGELGETYIHLCDPAASVRYYQLAIATQKGRLLLDNIITTYYKSCLASFYLYNNESDKAAELIKSCLAFLDTVSEPLHPALLNVYLTTADYFIMSDNPDMVTEKLLRYATQILKKSYPANYFRYGILYYLRSQIEYYKNDYEGALLYSSHSLNISFLYPTLLQYQELNYAMMASIYLWYKHDYKKAIEYCNQALNNIHGTNESSTHFYYLLGFTYKIINNQQLAVDFFNKVIHTASTCLLFKDQGICAQAYLELAKIYMFSNKPELVRSYLKKALGTSWGFSGKSGLNPVIYKELGRTYYLTREYTKALSLFQQSIISGCRNFSDTSVLSNPVISDIQITYPLIETFYLKAYMLYKLYEEDTKNLNYLKTALVCQELSVKLTERTVLDLDEENSGLNLISLKAMALNNAVSYATLLYLRTGNRQYAEKALEHAEKSKMQILLINTLKKNNRLKSGVPDSLIFKEDNLNDEILEIENHLTLNEKSGNISGLNENLLEKLTGLYDSRDEFTNRLEEAYPAYYKSKYSFKVAGIDKIQHILDDHQVILEYQLLNTEIIIFVITKNDFSIHYQLIDNQVPENIRQLRNALTSDPMRSDQQNAFQAFTGSSYYLYEKLIAPVYNKIKNKHLIIIPHNELTQIPFEVLISKKPEDNQPTDYKSLSYLIKEFPVVYAYSANLLLDQNQGKKYGSGTAIFLPDYSTYNGNIKQFRFPVLKGADSEASAIKKLSHGRLYKGGLADEATFKARASSYRVLHIASHTLLDEKNPSLSSMVMTAPADSGEDGNLYAYELSQMDLNAQLVVLSGCNTGFGLLRKSEGLISIARSFFYTGVRTVMYTLWPVADEAGATLIVNFYKELKHRQRLDDALRVSKLNFLKNADPVKAHPFYWAGYVIVGKTDKVQLTEFPAWSKIVLAILLTLTLSTFVYRKFRA